MAGIGGLPFADWGDGADRVCVTIEAPDRMYRGSAHVIRACANMWRKELQRAYGSRLQIVGASAGKFVDPQVWRAAILGKQSKEVDWKALAVWYAGSNLPPGSDHNVAEAYCLCEYARSMHRLQITTPKRKKIKHG